MDKEELTPKSKIKKYRNDYYKNRYKTDQVYRAKRLAYYSRKTEDCKKCGKRIPSYDLGVCYKCDPSQIKSDLGRKKKIEVKNEEPELQEFNYCCPKCNHKF